MNDFKTARREVLPDAEALAHCAAKWLVDLAVTASGPFRLCLSGGSTPKRLYEILATSYKFDFPWRHVHFYWGDERYVPATSEKSNYRMTDLAMLTHVPVPPENIHPVLTESETVALAAERYQACLIRHYGVDKLDPARPFFDVTLLGLGEDAHTASLFPGNKALKVTDRWVVDVPDGTPPPRITLTYPLLNSSRHVAFLIAGDAKREPLARVLKGDASAPAAHIAPVGDLHLFLDEAAAKPA